MLVTDFGMVIEVRLLQFTKALLPILATELPIVIEVIERPAKAFSGIFVTELPIVTDSIL